jgi:predicted amidophosphoribosyltransferase
VVCCGPTAYPFAHCFACRTLARRLRLPLVPVLPASLCPLPGPLYRVLMGYKESPVDEARRQFARRLGELFSVFLTDHRACIEAALGGPVELVLPVPSSSRPGRAPLERVDGLAALVVAALGHGARWLPPALQQASRDIGHMRPNVEAFAVPRPCRDAVRAARVVLLDDTYVSGSRAQSAAATLRLARARAVVIVPLGRVVRPERFAAHAAFVDRSPLGDGHRSRCVLPQTRAASA